VAEKIIYVEQGIARPDPAPQNGDIIYAFNNRRILQIHAYVICWPRVNGLKVGGYITGQPFAPLLEKYLAHIHPWKFIRTGMTHAKAIALRDMPDKGILKGQEVDASKTADINNYVFRRRVKGKQPLFGTNGREIWYGGRSDLSVACINKIWDDIENDTPKVRVDHMRMPLDNTTRNCHLWIPVPDFTDDERHSYEEAVHDNTDPKNLVLKKHRKRKIDWENLPRLSGDTITKIKNPDIPMDMRVFADWDVKAIVEVKE